VDRCYGPSRDDRIRISTAYRAMIGPIAADAGRKRQISPVTIRMDGSASPNRDMMVRFMTKDQRKRPHQATTARIQRIS
jgi:hypothetical protein